MEQDNHLARPAFAVPGQENGTDGKTLASYLSQGRIETMNKVKEALDKDKSKAYDDLCRASQPDKKKKK